MSATYETFLATKRRAMHPLGLEPTTLPTSLFPWQAAIVRWAARKGRAAIWADCGLGKTAMQLAWADTMARRTLILAPLCVAEQTVIEGQKFGIDVVYDATGTNTTGRIIITNYERLEHFDPDDFGAVVLDESSILKAFDGKTRTRLIAAFQRTPYRLCCTATPSPNDIAELANHAEFLGLMTRAEFLATWFVHDDAGWRMKRHAVQPFYRWMASWAVALRRPSDIGYADDGFDLPPLSIRDEVVESTGPSTTLFPELGLKGITGRMVARRDSLDSRVAAVERLTRAGKTGHAHTSCQWIVWCGLHAESDAMLDAVADAVNVKGSDTYAEKRAAVMGFCAGDIRVMVSKPKILGFGLNFQHCHHMAFLGLSDSYETYYQCIRRCWRFGQRSPVTAHVVVSDAEWAVVENVRRKEATADTLSRELLAHMRDFEREEIAC